MLILVPPSETKRDGGAQGSALDLGTLGFPSLTRQRRQVLAGVRRLAQNRSAMALALKLGPRQGGELIRNRRLRDSPVLPALERYTGVLYEALGAHTLTASARRFASGHLAIHSALFGLLRAQDAIPAYRLSCNTKLPGVALSVWRAPITRALAARGEFILDLRSAGYVRLGPVPPERSSYLRVVADGAYGHRRALNHFNKQGKGAFVRALLEAGIDHPDAASLLAWASGAGIRMCPAVSGEPGELELVV